MTLWQKIGAGALLIALLVGILFVRIPPGVAQTPSIVLEWTAPGDDGNIGAAAAYQGRMSTTPVGADTLGWWNAATALSGFPAPAVAGTKQTLTIGSGLSWGTTYYFIIRAVDDGLPVAVVNGVPQAPVPNLSSWSNVATKALGPAPDTVAPARVIDLIAR